MFHRRQRVDLRRLRLRSWNEFDGMVPLPVLREDIEVFFGKYGLESSDAVRQNEGFLPCLCRSTGSFCKFLGGRHEELVPWLVFSFLSPNGGLVLLQIFHILWAGSGPADVESSGLHPLPQCLFLSYHAASFASRGTLVHLYFSGLPIDLRVVVLEPGITEDHALPSEAGDSEERPFGVGFVTGNHVYHFRDLTYLVGGAIHIVHWYGARDVPGVNAFRSDEVSIYEVARGSRVQKRLDGMHLAGVCGTDFYREDD